jgi:hypothetical protein
VIGALAVPLIKPRVPVIPHTGSGPRTRVPRERAWLGRSALYAFGGAVLLTSLANFVPSVYLPGAYMVITMPSPELKCSACSVRRGPATSYIHRHAPRLFDECGVCPGNSRLRASLGPHPSAWCCAPLCARLGRSVFAPLGVRDSAQRAHYIRNRVWLPRAELLRGLVRTHHRCRQCAPRFAH